MKKNIFKLKLNNILRYILVLLGVGIYIFLFDDSKSEQIKEYRKELSVSSERRITKAYIYEIGRKYHTLEYRFILEGVKYTGFSRYIYPKQKFIENTDSIWVYYKAGNPKVNLWVGMFE